MTPVEPERGKFFEPENLSNLNLQNIEDFWGDDSVDRISDFVAAHHFEYNSDHIGSIRFSAKTLGYMAVSGFLSQEIATEAQEERASDIAALVFPGDSQGKEYEEFRDKY
ncbi:hypothetical protein JW935_18745 [candidate division KSB1 bacterium]|nr:hypothetical protein [candidate division KSB1 bacterium]